LNSSIKDKCLFPLLYLSFFFFMLAEGAAAAAVTTGEAKKNEQQEANHKHSLPIRFMKI